MLSIENNNEKQKENLPFGKINNFPKPSFFLQENMFYIKTWHNLVCFGRAWVKCG